MKLLFVGNFNVTRGSGYATILRNVCAELSQRHKVTVLGYEWDRAQHDYPFQVIPSDYSWIPVQTLRLQQAMQFDHVILAMDVPKIEQILLEISRQGINWNVPVSGLFPIESDPLIGNWARALSFLHRRFVISEFGKRELEKRGLDGVFLPMTAHVPEREVGMQAARQALAEVPAEFGDPSILDTAGPVALTVADNQERKDLPAIARALKHLAQEQNTHMVWLLVTAWGSPYGWELRDLLETRLEVIGQTVVYSGLSEEDLDLAYWAADFFVIASQAEGACLPLYEAMARDKVCIAPAHTAISEALMDGRGILVTSNGATVHPWGNVNRYHVRPADLAAAMQSFAVPAERNLVGFIESRPWSLAAKRIEEML